MKRVEVDGEVFEYNSISELPDDIIAAIYEDDIPEVRVSKDSRPDHIMHNKNIKRILNHLEGGL